MRGSTVRYWSRVIGLAARAHSVRPEAIRVRGHGGRYRVTLYTVDEERGDVRAVAQTLMEHTGAEVVPDVQGEERDG